MTTTTTALNDASELLFGSRGIGATNFKLFPGSQRESTAEAIAAAVSASVTRFLNNELEEVVL